MGSMDRQHEELSKLEKSLERALGLVRSLSGDDLTATRWLEAAAVLGSHTADARADSSNVRQSLIGGARTAVLLYLRGHVGEAVPPHVLEGVAGIREWARRIRELREVGWDIECLGSGPNAHYRLNDEQLEEEVARGEQVIKSIKGSNPKDRIIEYLLHLCPWPAGPRQLEQVAGIPAWRHAVGELIDEGWMIRSHDDEPELAPGYYRLARIDD